MFSSEKCRLVLADPSLAAQCAPSDDSHAVLRDSSNMQMGFLPSLRRRRDRTLNSAWHVVVLQFFSSPRDPIDVSVSPPACLLPASAALLPPSCHTAETPSAAGRARRRHVPVLSHASCAALMPSHAAAVRAPRCSRQPPKGIVSLSHRRTEGSFVPSLQLWLAVSSASESHFCAPGDAIP
jgi:hypothetical protein